MTTKTTRAAAPATPGGKAEKSTPAKVAEAAKDTASDLALKAADQVHDTAEGAKSAVADDVSGVAGALRSAANDMRSGSPQERTIGQLAEGLADVSDAIRDKDLGAIMRDANDLARRNPVLFLGGAALLGFAATRFVKASRPDHGTAGQAPQTYAQDNPYSAAPQSTRGGAS